MTTAQQRPAAQTRAEAREAAGGATWAEQQAAQGCTPGRGLGRPPRRLWALTPVDPGVAPAGGMGLVLWLTGGYMPGQVLELFGGTYRVERRIAGNQMGASAGRDYLRTCVSDGLGIKVRRLQEALKEGQRVDQLHDGVYISPDPPEAAPLTPAPPAG